MAEIAVQRIPRRLSGLGRTLGRSAEFAAGAPAHYRDRQWQASCQLDMTPNLSGWKKSAGATPHAVPDMRQQKRVISGISGAKPLQVIPAASALDENHHLRIGALARSETDCPQVVAVK